MSRRYTYITRAQFDLHPDYAPIIRRLQQGDADTLTLRRELGSGLRTKSMDTVLSRINRLRHAGIVERVRGRRGNLAMWHFVPPRGESVPKAPKVVDRNDGNGANIAGRREAHEFRPLRYDMHELRRLAEETR